MENINETKKNHWLKWWKQKVVCEWNIVWCQLQWFSPFPISPFSITFHLVHYYWRYVLKYYLSHHICLKENKTEIVLYAKWNWLMNIFRFALIRGKFEIIYIGRMLIHSAYLNSDYTHMQIPMLKSNGLAWRISLLARRLYVDHCIVTHRAICHESEIVFVQKYGED